MTRAVYRANGNPGYVDNDASRAHLHRRGAGVRHASTPSRKSAAPTQITDGEFDEGGMQWSPDGSTIYFTSTRVPEPYFDELGDELYAVPAGGGAITKVAAIEGSIGNISVSPDGKRIAFVGTLRGKPIRSYSQPDLLGRTDRPRSTRVRPDAEEPDGRLRLRHRRRHRRRSGAAARRRPQADRLVDGSARR